MSNLYQFSDFEASIRIFRNDEGGRTSPPFNGIRWDFNYAEEQTDAGLYMIWPDFMDENDKSLPTDKPLPIDQPLQARMLILADELRAQIHRSRIRVGTQFFCCEGLRRVAEGSVIRVTGLHLERVTPTSFGMSTEAKTKVVELIQAGHRISAVHAIRDATGVGLAEAKAQMEVILSEMIGNTSR